MRNARSRRFVPDNRGRFSLIDPEVDMRARARRLDRAAQALEVDAIQLNSHALAPSSADFADARKSASSIASARYGGSLSSARCLRQYPAIPAAALTAEIRHACDQSIRDPECTSARRI